MAKGNLPLYAIIHPFRRPLALGREEIPYFANYTVAEPCLRIRVQHGAGGIDIYLNGEFLRDLSHSSMELHACNKLLFRSDL